MLHGEHHQHSAEQRGTAQHVERLDVFRALDGRCLRAREFNRTRTDPRPSLADTPSEDGL